MEKKAEELNENGWCTIPRPQFSVDDRCLIWLGTVFQLEGVLPVPFLPYQY